MFQKKNIQSTCSRHLETRHLEFQDGGSTAAMDARTLSENQPQWLSAESNVSCANCILVKEQLHSILLELESARTISALLQDDIKNATAPDASRIPKPSPAYESSVYEQAGDEWIPVVHNTNKKTKTPAVTSTKTEQPIMSSNRFAPLTNLNENLTDETRLACIVCRRQHQNPPLTKLVLVIKYLR